MPNLNKGKDVREIKQIIAGMEDIDRFHLLTEPAVEIDLESIFDNEITIKTMNPYKLDAVIGVDIPLNERMYSVIGRVKAVKVLGKHYSIKIKADFIPQNMYADIERIIDMAVL